jgi:hypothetical protein
MTRPPGRDTSEFKAPPATGVSNTRYNQKCKISKIYLEGAVNKGCRDF